MVVTSDDSSTAGSGGGGDQSQIGSFTSATGTPERSRKRRLRFVAMLLGASLTVSLAAVGPAAAHSPTHTCQCVDYIKHRWNITGATGNAKDMGTALVNNYGFRRVSSPVAGAVIIFQPSFGGVNSTYGHVSRIESFSTTSDGKWQVKVSHANYGSGQYTAWNCNNMRTDTMRSYAKGSSSVSYYVR